MVNQKEVAVVHHCVFVVNGGSPLQFHGEWSVRWRWRSVMQREKGGVWSDDMREKGGVRVDMAATACFR